MKAACASRNRSGTGREGDCIPNRWGSLERLFLQRSIDHFNFLRLSAEFAKLFSHETEERLGDGQDDRSDKKSQEAKCLDAAQERQKDIQWMKFYMSADHKWSDDVIRHSD